MIDETDRRLIHEWLDALYGAWGPGLPCHVSKSPDYSVEASGVPRDMEAGPISVEGWVAWRMLPSTVTEDEVELIERRTSRLPPLFQAYLVSRFHLFDQIQVGSDSYLFPALPSDAPLRELQWRLAAWESLLNAGFVPFAEYHNGWGPVCFDRERRRDDGDCPVVWFDHEALHGLPEQRVGDRDTLESLAQPLYPGFREMIQCGLDRSGANRA